MTFLQEYEMYQWEDESKRGGSMYVGMVLFTAAAALAVLLFLVFYPQIEKLNQESPLLINAMFVPAMAVGFLYGYRITARAVRPSEFRSPARRSLTKIFLFLFVIGGMFSSVSFAINGGSILPDFSILEDGLVPWLNEFVTANGGATFLIISSITLMAAASRRVVGMNHGVINRLATFGGTFVFFTMLALSFTPSDPTASGVFLYTFYQAGIVVGALYEMNRLTRNQNMLEDYSNGF